MIQARDKKAVEIIDKVLAVVRERVPKEQAAVVEPFVRHYFAGTALDDLQDSEVANLYGAALAHFNFARVREPGKPKIHVYNPQLDQHGWQSTHTIVEIVNDDMPFLVDSVRMSLNQRGLTNHLIIHPVLGVRRSGDGVLSEVTSFDARGEGLLTEAVMHFEVDRQTEPEVLEGIRRDIERVLEEVRLVVGDWQTMRGRVDEILNGLDAEAPPVEAADLAEARAFLEWVNQNHFTFLGYREYRLLEENGEDVLRAVPGSGLGVLRQGGDGGVSQSFAALPPEMRRVARAPTLLIVTKANSQSTVHRPGYMDYIGVKRFDANGEVVGERRFLGLYTSAAYNRSTREIPLLRRKVAGVVERAGYPGNSHAGKALINILENFPRDELFQFSDEELYATAMGILQLQERQRIRLFVRQDPYGRFFSCLVYVPRDRFSTEVRHRIREVLEAELAGESSEFTVQISESVLARIHFIVRIPTGAVPDYDVAAIERRIVEVTRAWRDDLHTALLEQLGEERGARLFRRYGEAFRADYREQYAPRVAVHDALKMDELRRAGRDLGMALYRPLEAPPAWLRFKLFRPGRPIPLSDALPMLEHMGLKVIDETPSKIKPADTDRVWIHDFGMEHGERALDLDQIKEIFQDAFDRIWHGEVEDDGFNALVLRARLDWREIAVLRAYCKYLRQVRATFSQAYMERALNSNPGIARALVAYFHARFDPARAEASAGEIETLSAEIEAALDAVANLDEDRILRGFFGVMQATLRTNFYQAGGDGGPKPYLSFKFDPSRVPELPRPRPMFEIFVYSPQVEGVHLRGGRVARGGLRWSDRFEDFRTEILGLVKAQQVKNAVIVPVGSKGGFVAKRLPAGGDRDAVQAEVIACYKTFIRGLLDLTDNLVGGKLVPPPGVVRHDSDDPYLVVAADKGTATFSDIANGVAAEYGFWLGDAFASGGSAGYDHKAMGITARGGWESVKRHFRELGKDIQNEDFTVVGIGDMAGDVFGNGMLLSRHIKLLGAFNHMHIFLDPEPDAEASYAERERLFKLPRSTWADYDPALISRGGGVYPRSAKSIKLSPEVRQALAIEAASLTPNELIRAMLQAPVDLLWNGGIGTYVKSADEQHADVGDRANDAVRVNGKELGCKVVGEGGNLGLTQLGRIEFALAGGRINTDAIDNSGGVDCSDHEVNIKILLNAVVDAGDMTRKQRDALLGEMTEEVAGLVLRNNYLQTQALSIALAQAPSMLDVHARLMRALEKAGKLVREIEYLPTEERIFERKSASLGLTGPELSVLLAYVKISLYDALLGSTLPEDPYLLQVLEDYFPTPLRERFGKQMAQHRLWREIIATEVVNGMVNRAGTTFAFRLGEETGAQADHIARAYLVAREVFAMRRFWGEVEALDNRVPAAVQTAMLLEGRKLVERAARWLLRNRARPLDVAATVEHFGEGAAVLAGRLFELVDESGREALEGRAAALAAEGVPDALARHVAGLDPLFSALDVVEAGRATGLDVEDVARVYFELGAALDLHWLRERIVALPRDNQWQGLARAALRDDLYAQQSALTCDVLRSECAAEAEAEACIRAWMERNAAPVARCRQVLADLRSGPTPDFAMLSVAMREIRALREVEGAVPAREVQPRAGRKQGGQAA